MAETTVQNIKIPAQFHEVARETLAKRTELLEERIRLAAELPLRFWNQQAHFTTPASGTPEKAIKGLPPVAKILDRFGIALNEVAETTGAPLKILRDVAEGSPHSPFVMVDVEDAVALTPESIQKARAGAVRCFTEAEWGSTLPFYRPAGLRLETCVEDVFSVLGTVGEMTEGRDFPVAGIVWPKAEHPSEIAWVCEMLTKIEGKLGIPENTIKFEFLVESGYALSQLTELAQTCVPRLAGIIWGIADFSADTNLPRIDNAHPLCDWARYEIVTVAGALGVPAIDCMTLNYPTPVHRGDDLSPDQRRENKEKILGALKEVYTDALHGIELGMTGKWVGHPLQLLMVMAAYRDAIPERQIISDVQELEAYQTSVEAGAGATVLGEGRTAYMADRATDRHVRARLRRATAWGLLDPAKAVELGVVTESETATLC